MRHQHDCGCVPGYWMSWAITFFIFFLWALWLAHQSRDKWIEATKTNRIIHTCEND